MICTNKGQITCKLEVVVLRDEAQLFAAEDGLCYAICIQFYKEVSAVGLYRVQRNEEVVSYFLVTKTIGHQVDHFMFALADVEAIQFVLVEGKCIGWGDEFCMMTF